MNAAGHAELFGEVRAQLAVAQEARAAALDAANIHLSCDHWNRVDVAREALCVALGVLEDAGVLEALAGLIPHIGEL